MIEIAASKYGWRPAPFQLRCEMCCKQEDTSESGLIYQKVVDTLKKLQCNSHKERTKKEYGVQQYSHDLKGIYHAVANFSSC